MVLKLLASNPYFLPPPHTVGNHLQLMNRQMQIISRQMPEQRKNMQRMPNSFACAAPTTRVPQVPSCLSRQGLMQGWESVCWGGREGIPLVENKNQSSEVSMFQSFKVSKFQHFKVSKFESSKVSNSNKNKNSFLIRTYQSFWYTNFSSFKCWDSHIYKNHIKMVWEFLRSFKVSWCLQKLV